MFLAISSLILPAIMTGKVCDGCLSPSPSVAAGQFDSDVVGVETAGSENCRLTVGRGATWGGEREGAGQGTGGGVQVRGCYGVSGHRAVEEQVLITSILIAGGDLSDLDLEDVLRPAPELDTVEGGLAAALDRLDDVLGREVRQDLTAQTFQSAAPQTFNCSLSNIPRLYRDGAAPLVNVESGGSRERVIPPVLGHPAGELAAPVLLSQFGQSHRSVALSSRVEIAPGLC